jgi:hypothetical protein
MKKIFTICTFIFLYATTEAQITSAASGNWNNPATWAGGVVPTSSDVVNIVSPHVVALDANGSARTIIISSGATLNINTVGTTLTVGDFNTGGGKDSVAVYGDVNISNGSLDIGGRLKQYSSAGNAWIQTGGIVRIDGNTGVIGTSVADGDYLLEVNVVLSGSPGFTYNPTAGTMLFVDPPAGATGRLMYYRTLSANLGGVHTIQYGDGVSTTAGGNAQGFINNTFTTAGSIVVNNPSGTNRMVTDTRMTSTQNLTVTAGVFNITGSLTVNNTGLNNGTINQTVSGLIAFTGGITNNGIITINNEMRLSGNLVNNTGASISGSRIYAGGNIVNDGTIDLSIVLGFARAAATASIVAQTVSGTGTFNTTAATLFIRNSHASGVTLDKNLLVTSLETNTGKLFLGASNITYSNPIVAGAPNVSNYIVTNGTGRLRFTNLTTTEVLFPIGTATTYNPVRINNGSGHTFSAGVQNGFTVTPPGTQHVNREWDLDDITGGTVGATVSLQWNTANEDPTFIRSICAVSHYDGTDWGIESAAGAAANPSAGIYTKTATGVSGFSPFTVSSNNVVLLCPASTISLPSDISGVTYQWQADNGSGYVNISDGAVYGGTAINTLTLTNTPGTLYGYKFRCVVNGVTFSQEYTIKFIAWWYGTVSNVWENTANWSCGGLPDANTDVILNGGKPNFPQVNSNVTVRTLRLNPGSTATVNSGFTLTILK